VRNPQIIRKKPSLFWLLLLAKQTTWLGGTKNHWSTVITSGQNFMLVAHHTLWIGMFSIAMIRHQKKSTLERVIDYSSESVIQFIPSKQTKASCPTGRDFQRKLYYVKLQNR
jgi:hypothetical protein